MSHHCRRFLQSPISRREMLGRCANGFGALALSALMTDKAFGNLLRSDSPTTTAKQLSAVPPHFRPRARNIIFLYMDGGPSHIDTFDPKARLHRENGQPFKMEMEPTQFNNNGKVLGSPWEFNQFGESGIPISSLFPNVARHADDLCVIRSMVSKFSEHTSANYFLHTGHGQAGRPSMGAWLNYGLGSENENLPGFVVLNGGLIPRGGLECFGSGFLPASHQASVFRPEYPPVANIEPLKNKKALQEQKLKLTRQLDQGLLDRLDYADPVEASVKNYELAFRMQAAVPELMELGQESTATKRLYGLEADYQSTQIFGRQCLLARRLVERGVRFIELTCPNVKADRWDQHGNLKDGHENNARAVDQPIAALLTDLKQRGMLESTIVLWAGEFGRTPFAQGKNGRDHNPFGFSIWLAGGGVKGGSTYGATDEYGYKAVENPVEIYDLHATLLHLLGIDHTRLTFHFSGRDMRLTDVHGNVIPEIIDS